MKKYLRLALVSGFVISASAHASDVDIDIDVTQHRGAARHATNYKDDVMSNTLYFSGRTYYSIISEAANGMLRPEDNHFFMAVVNRFNTKNTGTGLSFNADNYHEFKRLCGKVLQYKFSEHTPMTEEAKKSTLNFAGSRSFELDYAMTTVAREAYEAKENYYGNKNI